MINVLKFNVETSFFIGDIHGEFKGLKSCIKKYDLKNCLLFCCGDIGFGFEKLQHYKDLIPKLNKLCKSNNVYVIFIRGNHDDPSYFDNTTINYSNIKAVSDYTIVQVFDINDKEKYNPLHSVLCIGGATSIDRTYRIGVMNKNIKDYIRYHQCTLDEAKKNIKKLYWENEHPILNKPLLDDIKNANIKIDVVCTHTCPSNAQPISKDGILYWCLQDNNLEEDLNIERCIMDQIKVNLLDDGHLLTHWIYGHYHYRNYEVIDDIKYVMLDMMRNGNYDYYELKNMI